MKIDEEKVKERKIFFTYVMKITYVVLGFIYLGISIYHIICAYIEYNKPSNYKNKYFIFVFAPALYYFLSFVFSLYCGLLLNPNHSRVVKIGVFVLNCLVLYYLHKNWYKFTY